MGCRKNYRYLTAAERERFVQALYHVKAQGRVDQFANEHDFHFDMGHGNSHFLPWHREFLRRFELALQDYHPEVTIPYWNSTVDQSPSDPLWDQAFMGQFNAAWGLGRNLGGGSLPTPATLQRVSRRNTYTRFWQDLESDVHNAPHPWVGGLMSGGTSPHDPVFYLHHCWIDMLWAHWQKRHPNAAFTASGPGAGLNDHMHPWTTTPADVLDFEAINGYFYPAFNAMWEDDWTHGWTTFMPFMLDGRYHYLSYKVDSGDVHIDRIRADGRGVDTVWEDTWTTGWTSFMPFLLNGSPHYLAYKVGNGAVAIDRIRPGALGIDTIWEDRWTSGWTAFEPFLVDGHPHYLAYKRGNGEVDIDRIRSDGLGVDTIWEDTWSKGWDIFMPFLLNGTPHHLAYKCGNGEVDIDRIRSDGLGVDTIWQSNWTPNWTSFVPFTLYGEPHFLAYKVGEGRVAVDRIRSNGQGVETMWEGQWTSGWTSFVPFQVAGRPHHLAYKRGGGDVDVDTMHLLCPNNLTWLLERLRAFRADQPWMITPRQADR